MVPKAIYPTVFGVLNRWLKLRQCYSEKPCEPWNSLLNSYAAFLKDHRGLVRLTAEGYVKFARRFLLWQFGNRKARWADVRAQDIWRYAEHCAEGYASGYAKSRLCALRRFLSFVQLRGACSAQLVQAIPRVANFRQHYSPGGLADAQWKKLLRSFDRRTAQGCCEHAAALCMIELGLRNCVVCEPTSNLP